VPVFTFSFDPRYGLSLVSGESVILDLSGVTINRLPDGTYSCAVSRGDEHPVRLVASTTTEGRLALARANGRECPAVPGFVEVTGTAAGRPNSLHDDIALAFGWEPATSTPC
jgi:hypothetical protein